MDEWDGIPSDFSDDDIDYSLDNDCKAFTIGNDVPWEMRQNKYFWCSVQGLIYIGFQPYRK